ncbi:DUF763 domain-containing protein [Hippea maritima]|uniref:DUF763 domain-containing protein n=1 Tax=Hippea maritima (strain ATCC 700847 / DSM 10411 / MH2) TaxID=760142 RepID=F2LV92_HIPMA|nr:DUF763 domain-containing protein [Hippea maritima]AEA33676.1 protein of unknown function DUF763 [Hippea maritima DSM 10411]
MARTGITNLPLHGGKAPKWLFDKMVELSEQLIYLLVLEYSQDGFLKKLSDPFWFQSFGCLLGFDWHSSGLTTTVCGALKVALNNGISSELGVFAAGGKGKTAIKTPDEIDIVSGRFSLDGDRLKYASKMAAKVDNAALQDGYRLYHHVIFFTKNNRWCVIQQGLNDKTSFARRYHWLWDIESFTEEPHKAICSQKKEGLVLDLTAKESLNTQKDSVEFLNMPANIIEKELNDIAYLDMPKRHYITTMDFDVKRLKRVLLRISHESPNTFEKLLGIRGVGEKTLRALSLISEVVYGDKPSYKDPARFSFAHGGKDGHPYPVNLEVYSESIETLKSIVSKAKIGYYDKVKALKRLSRLI